MKLAILLVLAVFAIAEAAPVEVHDSKVALAPTLKVLDVEGPYPVAGTEVAALDVSKKLCPVCVQFMGQAINQLLNVIMNAGVMGSCGKLCSYLPNKTEATVCNLLCDIVGIKGFIALIDKVDPDPIFYCQSLKVCPKAADAAATVNNVTAVPAAIQQGATVAIESIFTVEKALGTGELSLGISPPDGMPFGTGTIAVGTAPGRYGVKFTLQTQPTQQEAFSPGVYGTSFSVCEGTCGSKHADAKVLGQGNSQFKITA